MLQFLRNKIKPFKKCTGNPSYSFEINNSGEQNQVTRTNQTTLCNNLDSDYELTGCSQTFTSKLGKKSKTSRFYNRFRRSGKKNSISSGDSNNDSLNNRETTNSFVNKEDCMSGQPTAVVFDSPALSLCSANMQPSSIKNGSVGFSEKFDWSDDDSYTNNDCINDLIDNTNFTQVCYYLACFFLLEFFCICLSRIGSTNIY